MQEWSRQNECCYYVPTYCENRIKRRLCRPPRFNFQNTSRLHPDRTKKLIDHTRALRGQLIKVRHITWMMRCPRPLPYDLWTVINNPRHQLYATRVGRKSSASSSSSFSVSISSSFHSHLPPPLPFILNFFLFLVLYSPFYLLLFVMPLFYFTSKISKSFPQNAF